MTWKPINTAFERVTDETPQSINVTLNQGHDLTHNKKDNHFERQRDLLGLPGYEQEDAQAAHVALAYCVREVTTRSTIRTWMNDVWLMKLEEKPICAIFSAPSSTIADHLNNEVIEGFFKRFNCFVRFVRGPSNKRATSVREILSGGFPPPHKPIDDLLLEELAVRKRGNL